MAQTLTIHHELAEVVIKAGDDVNKSRLKKLIRSTLVNTSKKPTYRHNKYTMKPKPDMVNTTKHPATICAYIALEQT